MTNLSEWLNNCTALKEKITQYRPLDQKQLAILEKNTKYEHIWSSNKIEGNKLSLNETVSILNGITVGGASLKDTLEVVNLSDAYDYMKDLISNKQPLSNVVIRDINRLVTENTAANKSEAGKYRTIDVMPYGAANNPYAKSFDIPNKVNDLINWSTSNRGNIHPIQYAAELHYTFVTIHPFSDGNGRTARLLMNFALIQESYPIVNLKGSKKERDDYINALENVRIQKSTDPFVDFIAKKTKETLKEQISTLERNEQSIKDAQKETNLKDFYLKHKDIDR